MVERGRSNSAVVIWPALRLLAKTPAGWSVRDQPADRSARPPQPPHRFSPRRLRVRSSGSRQQLGVRLPGEGQRSASVTGTSSRGTRGGPGASARPRARRRCRLHFSPPRAAGSAAAPPGCAPPARRRSCRRGPQEALVLHAGDDVLPAVGLQEARADGVRLAVRRGRARRRRRSSRRRRPPAPAGCRRRRATSSIRSSTPRRAPPA